MEVKADEILLLVQGRVKIPAPMLRPGRTVGVGQKNGDFSGDNSRSPLWLLIENSLWEGCWDFIEAVKGRECRKEKETGNTLPTYISLLRSGIFIKTPIVVMYNRLGL